MRLCFPSPLCSLLLLLLLFTLFFQLPLLLLLHLRNHLQALASDTNPTMVGLLRFLQAMPNRNHSPFLRMVQRIAENPF